MVRSSKDLPPPLEVVMSDEVVTFWENLIKQHGRKAGESRHIAKDILRDGAEWIVLGAEYQPTGAKYRWHGLERDTPHRRRWVAFQWTIAGEGMLRVGDKYYPQTPGMAFAVQVPSDHEYSIVPDGPGWKFVFLRLNGTWIADRIMEVAEKVQCSFPLASNSRLGAETIRFFEQGYAGVLRDPFEADKATLDWIVEFRRHIHHLLHPHDSRMEILEIADAFYEENKTRSFGVEDFASELGMSRNRATTHFHRLTGKTPAAYFMELRLRDAATLLGQGHKLDYIAKETGFADANHLCKSFKRVYHTTPGQFRRVLGSKIVS